MAENDLEEGDDFNTTPYALQTAGATYTPNYIPRTEDHVSVAMSDLREFKAGVVEEAAQFVFAEFFLAGALWLGFERLFTIDDPMHDPIFLCCLFSVILGLVVGFFGVRQLIRRKGKIDLIMEAAEKEKKRQQAAIQKSWTASAAVSQPETT